MNQRQQAFADYYLELGNAAEAARKAGYSQRTARRIGSQLLTNMDIKAYILHRQEQDEAHRIADGNEVLAFFTAVMRGEVRDQFGFDPSLSDRLKAADALMKRYMPTLRIDDCGLLADIIEAVKGIE